MSSDEQRHSTSRNLVRISGAGYRENIEQQDFDRQAQVALSSSQSFEDGLTLAPLSYPVSRRPMSGATHYTDI